MGLSGIATPFYVGAAFVSNLFLIPVTMLGVNLNPFLINTLILMTSSIGFGTQPAFYDYIVELSFPVSEEVIGTLFECIYQLISTVTSIYIDILNVETAQQAQNVFWLGSEAGVLVMMLFLSHREELRRVKCEKEEGEGEREKSKVEAI